MIGSLCDPISWKGDEYKEPNHPGARAPPFRTSRIVRIRGPPGVNCHKCNRKPAGDQSLALVKFIEICEVPTLQKPRQQPHRGTIQETHAQTFLQHQWLLIKLLTQDRLLSWNDIDVHSPVWSIKTANGIVYIQLQKAKTYRIEKTRKMIAGL